MSQKKKSPNKKKIYRIPESIMAQVDLFPINAPASNKSNLIPYFNLNEGQKALLQGVTQGHIKRYPQVNNALMVTHKELKSAYEQLKYYGRICDSYKFEHKSGSSSFQVNQAYLEQLQALCVSKDLKPFLTNGDVNAEFLKKMQELRFDKESIIYKIEQAYLKIGLLEEKLKKALASYANTKLYLSDVNLADANPQSRIDVNLLFDIQIHAQKLVDEIEQLNQLFALCLPKIPEVYQYIVKKGINLHVVDFMSIAMYGFEFTKNAFGNRMVIYAVKARMRVGIEKKDAYKK